MGSQSLVFFSFPGVCPTRARKEKKLSARSYQRLHTISSSIPLTGTLFLFFLFARAPQRRKQRKYWPPERKEPSCLLARPPFAKSICGWTGREQDWFLERRGREMQRRPEYSFLLTIASLLSSSLLSRSWSARARRGEEDSWAPNVSSF